MWRHTTERILEMPLKLYLYVPKSNVIPDKIISESVGIFAKNREDADRMILDNTEIFEKIAKSLKTNPDEIDVYEIEVKEGESFLQRSVVDS